MENQEIKFVDDNEGVIFVLNFEKSYVKEKLENDTVKYAKSFLDFKLNYFNVYPTNNVIGFSSNIDCIAILMGDIIESYLQLKMNLNQNI